MLRFSWWVGGMMMFTSEVPLLCLQDLLGTC
ncbi:hypothetical protein KC19_1G084300 [Ceratodon purpureus]|uniref:Uncharacterized protein n=1 Tax=Ceratodon purpureus TaxID=3225 RepID=A0A8T0J5D3_CERPU|nr:hypothetical protein KC19_1G084300 [Ceratodon purpureus]